MSARGRRKVLFMRTRYRTRGFSPPPSPLALGPVDDGETGAGGTDLPHDGGTTNPTTIPTSPVVVGDGVTVSQSAATTAAESPRPSAKRGEKLHVCVTSGTSDEHLANVGAASPHHTRCPSVDAPATPSPPPPPPAIYRRARPTGTYIRSHSSPICPLMDADSYAGRSAEPITAADAALIEVSNHNFFTRHRTHEAAVAHQVACEIALERVKQHRRLGTRADDWDEELALEGLPPLQRSERRPGPGDGLEEKENWRVD
ncbi:hypothetical protein DFP73DRAFT_634329 [Morchella snyderi]|nr:hypothetical protein DFP73DRAFT_634329 [Morchella snyderi]